MNELRKIVSPKPVHSINDHRMKKKTTVILGTPNSFQKLSCKIYITNVYNWYFFINKKEILQGNMRLSQNILIFEVASLTKVHIT